MNEPIAAQHRFPLLTFALGMALASCAQMEPPNTTPSPGAGVQSMKTDPKPPATDIAVAPGATTDNATFGAGCFWCVEAIFTELNGVLSVTSGYAGGTVKNPGYKEVCTGNTGHAEVARIIYDPSKISFDELLEVFWQTHDPTTLNRQGHDSGTQYRSVIFHHNADQKARAEHYKAELDKSGAWSAPIVTEISPLTDFYPAEDYHQNYYAQNGEQGYCQMVIRPKVEKFRAVFAGKLKP